MSQFGQKGGVNIFQKCLKFKNFPSVSNFLVFFSDASPKVVLQQKVVIVVKLHPERADLTPFQLVEVKVDFVLAYHIKKEEKNKDGTHTHTQLLTEGITLGTFLKFYVSGTLF